MTAEPAGHVAWSPDPVKQRRALYTVEDVLFLPDDAPRVELRDGVMIVVPSPTFNHQDIGGLLWFWLRQHAPAEFRAAMATGVALGFKDTLEPDVLLVDAEVLGSHHFADANRVCLAVEIVSPGTKRRDRLEKPAEYAAAGIPHFWRIEQDPLNVFAYDLVDGRYELVADATHELVLTAPFAIRLPIADITP